MTELLLRLAFALALLLGTPILLAICLGVALCGPRGRRIEMARGLSRTLCGAADGDGDVTYSAMSEDLRRRGKSRWRVPVVDALPGNGPGHCREAWDWHRAHGLVGDKA